MKKWNAFSWHFKVEALVRATTTSLASMSRLFQVTRLSGLKCSSQDICKYDFPEYTSEELNNLIDHFNETVIALELVDPNNPKQIMTRMERMFRRLYPDQMEGNFLRGFLKAVNKRIK